MAASELKCNTAEEEEGTSEGRRVGEPRASAGEPEPELFSTRAFSSRIIHCTVCGVG